MPLSGGIVLAICGGELGHVPGAHLNPAVTLGLAVIRRLPWSAVPTYVLAQFGGALGAAKVTDARVPQGVAAMAIGSALAAAILISGPLSRAGSTRPDPSGR